MRARFLLIAAVAVWSGPGCTHTALERRTVKQASTLTDLQYQQVLDNLATFACNKDALAWHVKLKGGVVQVADQGNAALGAEFPTPVVGEAVTKLFPSVGAQRGIVGQWDVDPAVDAGELELLGLAYRKAVCPQDPELTAKIDEATCELCLTYDILPSKETLQRIINAKGFNKFFEDIGKDTADIGKRIVDLEGKITALGVPAEKDAAKQAEKAHLTKLLKELVEQKINLEQTQAAVVRLFEASAGARGIRLYGGTGQGATGMKGAEGQSVAGEADYLLIALHRVCDPSYLPPAWKHTPSERNIGLAAQAGDKIKKLQELNEPTSQFNTPWLCRGAKTDMPRCACYVGRARHCGQECYVWVMPEQLHILRDFALVVLTLAPNEAQDLFPRGAAFSPTVGRR